MKKTSLLMIAFVSATLAFTACGSGESTETTTDTSTESVTPAPMDTTTVPADTASMTDTTTK